jgi:hypothetical protein
MIVCDNEGRRWPRLRVDREEGVAAEEGGLGILTMEKDGTGDGECGKLI